MRTAAWGRAVRYLWKAATSQEARWVSATTPATAADRGPPSKAAISPRISPAQAGERHHRPAERGLGDVDDPREDQVELAARVALAEDGLTLLEDLLLRERGERVGVGRRERREELDRLEEVAGDHGPAKLLPPDGPVKPRKKQGKMD
jgi:hypothetical protein